MKVFGSFWQTYPQQSLCTVQHKMLFNSQIILAGYFVITDVVLQSQFIYYRCRVSKRKKEERGNIFLFYIYSLISYILKMTNTFLLYLILQIAIASYLCTSDCIQWSQYTVYNIRRFRRNRSAAAGCMFVNVFLFYMITSCLSSKTI